jgi:hypothetical protein
VFLITNDIKDIKHIKDFKDFKDFNWTERLGAWAAAQRNFGPWPLALGPSEGKLVVVRKRDSSANIWLPQSV